MKKTTTEYEFHNWFPEWQGIKFRRFDAIVFDTIWEYSLYIGFLEIRKWTKLKRK